jgi:hypothetical protein
MRRGERRVKKEMGRMKAEGKNGDKEPRRVKRGVMKKKRGEGRMLMRYKGMIEKEWKIRSMKGGKGRKENLFINKRIATGISAGQCRRREGGERSSA